MKRKEKYECNAIQNWSVNDRSSNNSIKMGSNFVILKLLTSVTKYH